MNKKMPPKKKKRFNKPNKKRRKLKRKLKHQYKKKIPKLMTGMQLIQMNLQPKWIKKR